MDLTEQQKMNNDLVDLGNKFFMAEHVTDGIVYTGTEVNLVDGLFEISRALRHIADSMDMRNTIEMGKGDS